MRSFRGLAVGVVGLSLALAGGVTLWLAGPEAAVASVDARPPNQQPYGSGLVIESQADSNFCVKDEPAPSVPASEASMSQCEFEPAQEWTFAHADGGSVVLIGGETGRCLDFSAKAPAYVTVANCTFSADEHFFVTSAGQIESTSGKKCLQAVQANQDAALQIVKCQSTTKLQFWTLAH